MKQKRTPKQLSRQSNEAGGAMKQSVKKIWNILSGVLVALVVILAIALAGTRLIGLNTYVVLSGSMEPAYETGSLLYVKEVPYTELEVGDVITFMLDEDTVATHRIVEVVSDETDSSVVRYQTKGDANNAVDGSLVHYKNVIGTPVFSIPKLGYIANYIQTPPGMYVAASAGALLLLLVLIPGLFGSRENDKENEKQKETRERSVEKVGKHSRQKQAW